MIEWLHRATSGLSVIFVGLLITAAWRIFPKGDRVRAATFASGGFLMIEALLGAALVIFGLVGHDDSAIRAFVVALHLGNTLALLAAGTLAAYWANLYLSPMDPPPANLSGTTSMWWLMCGMVGVAVVAITGAVTALGDTLFPVGSGVGGTLPQTMQEQFLVHLRVVHPLLAVTVAAAVLVLAGIHRADPGNAPVVRHSASRVIVLILAQVVVGLATILFAAPAGLQIIHLLVADLLWIAVLTWSAAYFESSDFMKCRASRRPQRR